MPLIREPASKSPFMAANRVGNARFVVGAESSTARNVAITLVDANEIVLAECGSVDAFLSSSPTVPTLSSAPGSGVAIGTNGLAITQVTNVAWKLVSNAVGLVDLTISGVGTFYLWLVMPSGNCVVSPAIVIV